MLSRSVTSSGTSEGLLHVLVSALYSDFAALLYVYVPLVFVTTVIPLFVAFIMDVKDHVRLVVTVFVLLLYATYVTSALMSLELPPAHRDTVETAPLRSTAHMHKKKIGARAANSVP